MNIGIVIPDRGDRPRFLSNCLRMLAAQTITPAIIKIVDYFPENKSCDITQRYRMGYESLANQGLDIIAFIENDDWYSKDYLEFMVNAWITADCPDIFGLNQSIYYHIRLRKYFIMYHNSRSAAMNTLIRPDLTFKWCQDHEPFTDIHLWNTLKGTIIYPTKTVSVGIKHGIGLCGGRSHIDKLDRYTHNDHDLSFLREKLDKDSFDFYSNYFSDEN
jgi:hypothetical protein